MRFSPVDVELAAASGVLPFGPCSSPPRSDVNRGKDFDPVTGVHVPTMADSVCFRTRRVLRGPFSDRDGKGTLTFADVTCLQVKFAAGYPQGITPGASAATGRASGS